MAKKSGNGFVVVKVEAAAPVAALPAMTREALELVVRTGLDACLNDKAKAVRIQRTEQVEMTEDEVLTVGFSANLWSWRNCGMGVDPMAGGTFRFANYDDANEDAIAKMMARFDAMVAKGWDVNAHVIAA